MSQLKTIIQDLINDRSEQAQSTIHQYLVQKMSSLTEAVKRAETDTGHQTPNYREGTKHIQGTVKDWMARMKVTPDDMEQAMSDAKELASYQKLTALYPYDSKPSEEKNGTFAFKVKGDQYRSRYYVYANGQIRGSTVDNWSDSDRHHRLASPKPMLVAGSPVKSLVKIYDNAFKELLTKSTKSNKKVKEDLDQLDEAKNALNWKIMFHPDNEPYPEAQVNKLIKQLNKAGTATLVKSNAKDLVIQVEFNKPVEEDDIWDHVNKANLDDELDWGGSITAQRPKKQ